MQVSNNRADGEANARRSAEETAADLEKEKTMRELEVQELISKHTLEIGRISASLSAVSQSVVVTGQVGRALIIVLVVLLRFVAPFTVI